MKKLTLLPLLMGCFLLIQACSKKDTENPEISLTSPVDGQNVFVGATFPFQATFTDNEELERYTIDISGTGLNWSMTTGGSLEGTTGEADRILTVAPDAQLGSYRLTVECFDKEGNRKEVEIELTVAPS